MRSALGSSALFIYIGVGVVKGRAWAVGPLKGRAQAVPAKGRIPRASFRGSVATARKREAFESLQQFLSQVIDFGIITYLCRCNAPLMEC